MAKQNSQQPNWTFPPFNLEKELMFPLISQNIHLIPEEIGVYVIYCLGQDSKRIIISRFAKPDYQGILYIGRTTKQNLRKRVYNFLLSSDIDKKTTNHSGALKYRRNTVIRDKLGFHILYVQYEVCPDPIQREKEMLLKYSLEFGELPPLNK